MRTMTTTLAIERTVGDEGGRGVDGKELNSQWRAKELLQVRFQRGDATLELMVENVGMRS